MFIRASTLVLAVVAGVLAIPGASTARTASQCDTDNLQCCNSTTPGESLTEGQAGLLGLVFPITSTVGLGCTPITVIGTGSGAACQQQPVCCSNNDANGLINVYCTPLNLNL